MPRTVLPSTLISDETIVRADLNVSSSGSAVIRKIIQGTGVSISSTGADPGTGDVTVSINTSSVVTSFNNRTGAVTLNNIDVTTALGFTPISGESDTLNTVTGRGDTTSNSITVGGITATGVTSTIYAGSGTRLRTEANNLVFERVSSSGFMKVYINQTTLSPTAKAYMGYNNATLHVILSNEHSTGNLELRTQDTTRLQIFANGNVGINTTSDSGYKFHVIGTSRLQGNSIITGTLSVSDTVTSGNGTINTSISYGSTFGIMGTQSNHALQIRTNNVTAINITATGDVSVNNNLTVAGNIVTQTSIKSMYQAGNEGGEIILNKPATGTVIDTSVTIDVFQDKVTEEVTLIYQRYLQE